MMTKHHKCCDQSAITNLVPLLLNHMLHGEIINVPLVFG